MHALEFADKLRDAKTERELAKNLRTLPEEERLTFIAEMLDVQLGVALDLANSCLQDRRLLEQLLAHCIEKSNNLSIPGVWLEKILPRVGFRRTVAILQQNIDVNATAIAGSIYYLLRRFKKEDDAAKKSFRDLFESAKARASDNPSVIKYLEGLEPLVKT